MIATAPVQHSVTRRLLRSVRAHDLLRLATLTAIAAFLADWATKSWALHTLHGTMPLGSLTLGVERNDAFAFSSGAGAVTPLFVVAVRLLALMTVVWLSRRVAAPSPRYAAGIGMLLGGGFGNAGDVLFRGGSVVDFIGAGPFSFDWSGELVHFHVVFNLADLCILIGLGLVAPVIRSAAIDVQRRLAAWESRVLRERVRI
jgi:signal peptidase II